MRLPTITAGGFVGFLLGAVGALDPSVLISTDDRSRGLLEVDDALSASVIVGAEQCRRQRQHDAAIIYLAAPPNKTKDWLDLLRSLKSLQHLKDKDRAEVRVFYDEEDQWSKEQLQQVLDTAAPRDACVVPVTFRKFSFSVRNVRTPWKKRSTWGYEHMCRFFFADIFQIADLKKFTYWMRVDTDAHFAHDAHVDAFRMLDESPGVSYLRSAEDRDCAGLVEGLPALVRNYYNRIVGKHKSGASFLSAHRTLPPLEKILPDDRNDKGALCVANYKNNIEVGRLADFRTPAMEAWRKAVLDAKGIYLHRWGDAPLRRLSVLLSGEEVRPLPDALMFSYRHKNNSFYDLSSWS